MSTSTLTVRNRFKTYLAHLAKRPLYFVSSTCLLFLVLTLGHLAAPSAEAAIDCNDAGVECHSGSLGSSTTWNSNVIHVIDDDFTIPSGRTLTLSAGTIVKVDQFSSDFINIEGNLVINGTVSQPVTITSDRDDSVGGDTDNSDANGSRGDYNGLLFKSGSSATISNLDLRFAGNRFEYGAIHIEGGTVSLTNVAISNSEWSGISVAPSDIDNLTLSNVTVRDSILAGIEIREGTINSTQTWATTSTPYIPTGNITVGSGGSLTIAAGVDIKFDDNQDLEILVDGVLNIEGSPTSFVDITSIDDNTAGGVTNQFGASGSSAFRGDWKSIHYRAGSSGSIRYADIRYGGENITNGQGAVHVVNGNVTLSHVIFREHYIAFSNNGTSPLPTITNSEFFENRIAASNYQSGVVVQATGNWWDSSLGPDDESDADGIVSIDNSGDEVSDYINYSNYALRYIFPRMALGRDALDLKATVNESGPDSPSVQIFFEGVASATWTATESIDWLSLTNSSGGDGDRVGMSIDTTGLEAGTTYRGIVLVSSPGVNLGNQEIEVELEVVTAAEAAPAIGVLESPMTFIGVEEGSNPTLDSVTIVNTGTGQIEWTLNETIGWLSLDKASGVGESTVTGSVDLSGIPAGRYRESFTISSAGASGSPRTVDVNLAVGCQAPEPADIFIVMDRSSSMSGERMETAKRAAVAFVEAIDLSRDRVGLVAFDTDAELVLPPSQNVSAVSNAILTLIPDGATDIAAGIATARAGFDSSSRNRVIILLSDGQSNEEAALDEAFAAKVEDTLLITIGLGTGIDEETLQRIASTPDDYYSSPSNAELNEAYSQIEVVVGCGAPSGTVERVFGPFIFED